MNRMTELRKSAKEYNVEIGKMTAKKDCLGYFDIYEDGDIVAESMLADSAAEAKADVFESLMFDRIPSDD